MRVRAWSTTISVWTQTSPSGCHSGSCGQPTSACISGNRRAIDLRSSASVEPDRRRRGAEQELFDLAPDALGRQVVERDAAPAARVSRRRPAARSGRRTARRAARAGCRRRSEPGSTTRSRRAGQVGAAVERVGVLAGQRIEADGVDGEVAPPRRIGKRHRRVALDGEASWPRPVFDSRRGSATSIGADLVDREALPDRLDAPEPREQRRQGRGRDAEHLEVEILRDRARAAGRARSRPRPTPARPRRRPPARWPAPARGPRPIWLTCLMVTRAGRDRVVGSEERSA